MLVFMFVEDGTYVSEGMSDSVSYMLVNEFGTCSCWCVGLVYVSVSG